MSKRLQKIYFFVFLCQNPVVFSFCKTKCQVCLRKLDPTNILPSTHLPIFNLKRRASGTELRFHARKSIWLLTSFSDLNETAPYFMETLKYSHFLRLLCLNPLRPPEFPDEQTAVLVAKVTVNVGELYHIKWTGPDTNSETNCGQFEVKESSIEVVTGL